MNQILMDSLGNSINYTEYQRLMKKLVLNKSTTGNDKTENLVNFTLLNDRRMARWDKKLVVPETVQNSIKSFNAPHTWLVITESWCGDAAHVIPVINKMAALNSNINLRLILRDDNEALMNQFLTNGAQAIPKLIILDSETLEVKDTYGPRPSIATQMVLDHKAEFNMITPEFKEELQRWYNKDKGQNVMRDLEQKLEQLQLNVSL
jgi:hypothetical protein